ncbi:MAG: hypothetical protein ACMUJM_14280 [bacterium]
MMKNRLLFYICLVIILLFPHRSFSHGIVSTVIEPSPRSVVVEAHYSDGEPMSYAKVTVKWMTADIPFQSGYTDHNGYFAFIPDREGEWTVIFEDSMAHRSEVKVAVTADGGADERTDTKNALSTLPMYVKIIVGLSMIFGLFGLSSLYIVRKKMRDSSMKI